MFRFKTPHAATSLRCIPALILTMLISMSTVYAQDEKRLPIPTATEKSKAQSTVKAAFSDLRNTKERSGRRTAISNLIDQAGSESDAAMRYALLDEAQTLAIQWQDTASLNATIDAIVTAFDIDPVETRLDAFATLARNASDKDIHRSIVVALIQAARYAQQADQFTAAKRIVASASLSVQRSGDTELRKTWVAERARLNILQREHARHEQYQVVLLRKPFDPTANYHVGRYECFVQGNWQRGLPRLQRGSNQEIADAAKLDLANPTTPQAVAAVADAWWQVAEKEQDGSQLRVQQRAVMWYEKAHDQLDGVKKVLANKRIKIVADELRRLPLPNIEIDASGAGTIDVLASINSDTKAFDMEWQIKNKQYYFTANNKGKRTPHINFDFELKGNYTLRLRFTRKSGKRFAGIHLPVGGHSVILALDHINNTGGLTMVDGKPVWHKENPTHVPNTPIQNAKEVRLDVQVTLQNGKARILALLNEKPFIDWIGKPTSLSVYRTMRSTFPNKLGIAADEGFYQVHEFTLRHLKD